VHAPADPPDLLPAPEERATHDLAQDSDPGEAAWDPASAPLSTPPPPPPPERGRAVGARGDSAPPGGTPAAGARDGATRPPATVARWLGATRRRALVATLLRAAIAGTAAGAATLVVAARLTGPVAHAPAAVLAWAAAVGASVAAAARLLRRLPGLSGAGAAGLLRPISSSLASEVRTAVELRSAPVAALGLSAELVEAHARRTAARLASIPPARVVPARAFLPPSTAAALAAAAAATAVAWLDPRTTAGLWALTHPGATDTSGAARAAVVARVDAELTFPEYLGRDRVRSVDVETLEVPAGTTIALTVVPRVPAREGQVEVAGRTVPLGRRGDGALVGELVAREGGALRVRVREEAGDDWLVDPKPRALRLTVDEAPRVELLAPEGDVIVDASAEVPVHWAAADDVALSVVEMVVRLPDGEERRQRLAAFSRDERRLAASGADSVVPDRFGAREGDRLVVRIEATDGDDVTGPHHGRSGERTITVGSAAERHDENLQAVEGLLGVALATLADRLEAPPPADIEAAIARRRRLAEGLGLLIGRLEAVAESLRRDERSRRADAAKLDALARDLRRADGREAALFRAARPAGEAPRAQADEALVSALEETVVALSDMVGRARIEDAAEVARELEEIRRRMASLLAELRRAESAEARRALLAEIARAEQRMAELGRRLARMATQVPSDFVNSEALATSRTQNTLQALRDAVERGDLDAAARQLEALSRDVEQIAAGIAGARDGFVEARFGERERALGEAMDAAEGLEAEQRELARRSGEAARRALERAERAGAGAPAEAVRRLEQRARQAGADLQTIEPGALGRSSREDLERARQRVSDVRDALRSGDLAEAARMAEQAAADTDDLAEGLAIDALFFGGTDGRAGQRARTAKDAARRMHDLAREIAEATPRVADFVDGADRQQLRGDAPRQRRVRDAARGLGERMARGPDGTPVSEDGARALADAVERMQAAERALERGDPRDAARAQEEALRHLEALREQLEQEAQGGGGGAGEDEGGRGGAGPGRGGRQRSGDGVDRGETVRIPGADEFRGPAERRRRVLDAMREDAPPGWEEAVRRYYQEVLR
jgi:hypothetical protein